MVTVLLAPWLKLPALQHLFELFEKEGATLRLVGGSVRDGLLGLPVNDIDFAVDRPPEWVMTLLEKNKVKVIPTGIEHGTVTAIIKNRPFQITTLRVDVKTFGRRAHVTFTEDWVQDALRRDFTINALYADKNGNLFDPVGGLDDLQNHYVRFIGDASQRIKEDYLRILRFFRFSARFGKEPYDKEGLEACRTYASHIPHLARERVTDEFLKLLDLPSPLYVLEAMRDTQVLTYILHPGSWEELKALVALEKEANIPASSLLRLAAFHPILAEVKSHLRLSNKQLSFLDFFQRDHRPVTLDSFKHQAYRWGKEKTFDLASLQTSRELSSQKISLQEAATFLKSLHCQFKTWTVPSFPLSGEDLLSLGVREGQKIGILLNQTEEWWISQDFEPEYEACMTFVSTLLSSKD